MAFPSFARGLLGAARRYEALLKALCLVMPGSPPVAPPSQGGERDCSFASGGKGSVARKRGHCSGASQRNKMNRNLYAQSRRPSRTSHQPNPTDYDSQIQNAGPVLRARPQPPGRRGSEDRTVDSSGTDDSGCGLRREQNKQDRENRPLDSYELSSAQLN
jgi:hypothetical protein